MRDGHDFASRKKAGRSHSDLKHLGHFLVPDPGFLPPLLFEVRGKKQPLGGAGSHCRAIFGARLPCGCLHTVVLLKHNLLVTKHNGLENDSCMALNRLSIESMNLDVCFERKHQPDMFDAGHPIRSKSGKENLYTCLPDPEISSS